MQNFLTAFQKLLITIKVNTMCIRKVVVSVLLLPLLGLTILKAQEIPAAAGGNGTGSTGSISYSFGQVFYTSAKGVGGELEEGVQHAYEIYLLPDPPGTINLIASVYPNPATDYVILSIENYNAADLSYQLIDLSGKMISNDAINGSRTSIGLSYLTSGTYFLKINTNNTLVKSFKIIKY